MGHDTKNYGGAAMVRELLAERDVASFSDVELMTLIVGKGRGERTARDLAEATLARVGGDLQRVAGMASPEAEDLTAATWARVQGAIELGRRVAAAAGRDDAPRSIRSTSEAVAYCRQRFARLATDATQEEFHIVTLDTKHQVITTHRVTVGTLDASLVHPREVFRPAIRDAAAAVLLVHNHPSGNPTPSPEDRAVTDRLERSGQTLGIDVLDHVVVASGGCVSLRAER